MTVPGKRGPGNRTVCAENLCREALLENGGEQGKHDGSDSEWALIAPFLPNSRAEGRERTTGG